MKTYTVTLMDCQISQADTDEAIAVFRDTIESALGGEEQVAAAYSAYEAVLRNYGEIPLSLRATDAEREIIARWGNAERAGERAAFAGWHNLGGAHFEVSAA